MTTIKALLFTGCVALWGMGAYAQTSISTDSLPLGSYLKGGDAIHVHIYPDTQSFISGIYHIQENGTISLPIVGVVSIKRMTSQQLEKHLTDALVTYLRFPTTRIEPLIRLSFSGGFAKSGLYYVNPRSSLWDAIRQAGGTTREDGLSRIKWTRSGLLLAPTISDKIESGASLQSIGIKSGDLFMVTIDPKQTAWQDFIRNGLPVLSFAITTLATTATLYIAFTSFSRGQP